MKATFARGNAVDNTQSVLFGIGYILLAMMKRPVLTIMKAAINANVASMMHAYFFDCWMSDLSVSSLLVSAAFRDDTLGTEKIQH